MASSTRCAALTAWLAKRENELGSLSVRSYIRPRPLPASWKSAMALTLFERLFFCASVSAPRMMTRPGASVSTAASGRCCKHGTSSCRPSTRSHAVIIITRITLLGVVMSTPIVESENAGTVCVASGGRRGEVYRWCPTEEIVSQRDHQNRRGAIRRLLGLISRRAEGFAARIATIRAASGSRSGHKSSHNSNRLRVMAHGIFDSFNKTGCGGLSLLSTK